MLATADAGQLDKWRDFAIKHPFGDDWLQASTIATQIINVIVQALSKRRLGEKDLLARDHFVPYRETRHKRPSFSESIANLKQFARMHDGQ